MKKLLFALLLTTYFGSAVAQSNQPTGLNITGKAVRNLKADQLQMTIQIQALDAEIGKAFSKGSEKSRAVLAFLKKTKAIVHVETQMMRLNERWEYRNGERYKLGYEVNQTISFKMDDFKQYEAVVTELIQLGVTGVDQVQFLSSKAASIREEVRLEAIANAIARAEATAKALGVKLGPVEFYEENGPAYPVYARMEMMDAKMNAGPIIEPGEAAVEAEVRIRFAIFAETE